MAVLQYADDTIICLEHDFDKVVNLKMFLVTFEMMSGLKVKFYKSEIFIVGGDDEINKNMPICLDVKLGSFLLNILGCQ